MLSGRPFDNYLSGIIKKKKKLDEFAFLTHHKAICRKKDIT